MKFSDYQLHPQLLKALEELKFETPTPIQDQTIPHLLKGRDVAGLAQTGTGKTGAFLIPMIDRVLRSREKYEAIQKESGASWREEPKEGETPEPQEEAGPVKDAATVVVAEEAEGRPLFAGWQPRNFILVLVPTRELAEQVQVNTDNFTKGTGLRSVAIYGGTSYEKQKAALEQGVEFVIATPGRLIDLYKEHFVDLKQVRAVIFDEADRMFDMGFKDDMKYILKRVPQDRQFLVFSATLNFDVLNTAYEFGADPIEINVSRDRATAEHVKDFIFHVGQEDKALYLLSLLRKHQPKQAIIFSNFKRNVERIAVFLNRNKIPAVGISSLLTQAQRNRVMEQFKGASEQNILVATDVAARGLDILGVDMVINFELPDDPENYVHRIGRTGRAGQEGQAFSLVSDRDVDALSRIQNYVNRKLETGWIEDEDLIKEFESFPSERDVDPMRPKRQEGRDGQRRPQRGGNRNERGERQKNRRSETTAGESSSSRNNERRPDRGPRRDRDQQRDPQRDQKQAGGRDSRRDSRSGGSQEHRDRKTGRHQQQNQQRLQAGAANGRPSDRRQGRNDSGNRRRYSGRVHTKAARAPAAPKTLGQKVSGFFKKLFGQ